MAGSVEILSNTVINNIRSIVWAWTCDASGDVSGVGAVQLAGSGKVLAIQSNPTTGVSDLFDLTIPMTKTYLNGIHIAGIADVLAGDGANLSNSTNGAQTLVTTALYLVPGSTLTPTIANAGNAQSGILTLFVSEDRQ